MRLRLLDVNVLLALAWPNHPFHEISRSWFVRVAKQGWASCLLTEAAFVRLSSNPAVVPTAKPPIQCYRLLEELKRFGRHSFLSDQRISAAKFKDAVERCLGHQQVNDALLVLLAEINGALLVTFDRRLSPLASSPGTVELLGADDHC